MTEDLQVAAIIVAPGRVLDFIDGRTQRKETPEEHVRQEIAKSLVREYRYAKSDIEVEYTIRVGSKRPRADLVVFPLVSSTHSRKQGSLSNANPRRLRHRTKRTA